MLTEDEILTLRQWFNELVAFMGVKGLRPIALLTAKPLPGGMVEVGSIECRFHRVPDDVVRAAARDGVESMIAARRQIATSQRIILPGE